MKRNPVAPLACRTMSLVLAAWVWGGSGGEIRAAETLASAVAQLKIPPDWVATTPTTWDLNKPWKDGRIEIRRLLGLEGSSQREAVKLTWLYAQKGDIGDGHELPMYLFMSGNYAWAAMAYPKHLQKVAGAGATHAYLCYASCLEHFAEYPQALKVLDQALKDLPPKPWQTHSTAKIHEHYGDLLAKMGQAAAAKEHYAEAMRLYPTSDQPYGRHLLPRLVDKIRNKLDLMTMAGLKTANLRDGAYTASSPGYADKQEVEVTVTVKTGRLADIRVKHQEKIELGATQIIPRRIVEKQSLQVDGITGATVTCQAIVDGTYHALKQAGLK